MKLTRGQWIKLEDAAWYQVASPTYDAPIDAETYDYRGPQPWKVASLTDRGPSHYYRFHVSGENLDLPPGHPDRAFSWDVPDLDSLNYDLSSVRA